MTVTADVLRERVDDVIADMERQFAIMAPALDGVVADILRGDRNAYQKLQAIGRDVIAPTIDHYGTATAALAAEWYDLNRELLKIPGSWSGATIQDPNVNTGPLIGGTVADFVSAESILAGIQAGMDLRVRQAANGTVMDSVIRDRQALGWGRVASVGCCPFCALLAGRGAVYRTRQTATFCPHENCRCQAIPLWKQNATAEGLRSREDTISTRRALSDKQRARQNRQASVWIAEHRDTLGLVS
jgi:hypothetical protein